MAAQRGALGSGPGCCTTGLLALTTAGTAVTGNPALREEGSLLAPGTVRVAELERWRRHSHEGSGPAAGAPRSGRRSAAARLRPKRMWHRSRKAGRQTATEVLDVGERAPPGGSAGRRASGGEAGKGSLSAKGSEGGGLAPKSSETACTAKGSERRLTRWSASETLAPWQARARWSESDALHARTASASRFKLWRKARSCPALPGPAISVAARDASEICSAA